MVYDGHANNIIWSIWYHELWTLSYGPFVHFTSLCSVLASPFSFDCGLDGEYDLERERDRLRDILNVMNYRNDVLELFINLFLKCETHEDNAS